MKFSKKHTMKNKKFTIGLVLLIAGSMAFTSCTKGKTNTEPTKDTEISTAADRVLLEMIASDMGEIIAQGADGGSTIFSGTVTSATAFPNRTLVYSNTGGWDGHTRSGTFTLDESASFTGADYYRMPGYAATATVTNYVVDNYTVDVTTLKVQNTTAGGWTLGKDLTWKHTYDFKVTKPDGRILHYNGYENKILSGYIYGTSTNTNAAVTGTNSVSNTIIWQKASKVGFWGEASGSIVQGKLYTSSVAKDKMLIRDYTCAPEKIFPPSIISRNERHPFISGVMRLSFGPDLGERVIDFGENTCDYNVSITIDGNTYQQDVNW
jgi:hypothetical protein